MSLFSFHGTYIIYQNRQIPLNSTTFFLDGGLDDTITEKYPYVYNDLRKLLEAVNERGWNEAASAGDEGIRNHAVTVYIAPYVYWIDDPDAVDVVRAEEGYDLPYGMVVDCDSLKLAGLAENPYDVVLAGNRGQSHGAQGNYTMFLFRVRDLEVCNLTMGNYCSVDLKYPLKPELNHEKRTLAITQAQLAKQQGDKLFAHNCNFVSRLNLNPVTGGKRCLYEHCHFESTDDALNGRAVYVECDFDFYANRPLYETGDSGAVFLGCRFRGYAKPDSIEQKQYFTKECGPVTVVDCEYRGELKGIAWTRYPLPSLKCYQYGMLFNGEPVTIGGDGAEETVLMEGKGILEAYRLEADGKVIYNTYNLLRGEDEWDPLQVKDFALRAGKDRVPAVLMVETSAEEIISGETGASLEARACYFYGKQAQEARISYFVSGEDTAYVRLKDQGDGTCLAEGINEEDTDKKVLIHAVTPDGLEGALELSVRPRLMSAPDFAKEPVIEGEKEGAKYRVCYKLEPESYQDRSLISWYRCDNAEGKNPILTAVSRGEPLREYLLTRGDVGYYLMAQVESRHTRSRLGDAVRAISQQPVSWDDFQNEGTLEETHRMVISTDFRNMPTARQEQIRPGFWTVDDYRPEDTMEFGNWNYKNNDNMEPWKYGRTGNGSIGEGLYQNVQGARLRYTPVEGRYKDMTLHLKLDPAKTAGQGFGNAGQYMDICIKFDTVTLTGYGLRIIRTREVSDGVTFVFIRYDHGKVRYLGEGIVTSCYRTGCGIILSAKRNLLSVHAESQTVQASKGDFKYALTVDMETQIEETSFGGISIQHTGTPGTGGWQNTTMFHYLEVQLEV